MINAFGINTVILWGNKKSAPRIWNAPQQYIPPLLHSFTHRIIWKYQLAYGTPAGKDDLTV